MFPSISLMIRYLPPVQPDSLIISSQTTKPAAIMRLLHYPSQGPPPRKTRSPSVPYGNDEELEEEDEDEKIIGIGAHTEYAVPILFFLQVRADHHIFMLFQISYEVHLLLFE
jgi:hypothetical protein